MLKKMAWNVFRKTGSIDVFLEIKALEQMEKEKENLALEVADEISILDDNKVGKDGTNKDEGNGNCRK